MDKEEVVYFSVNNWFCGQDYPPTDYKEENFGVEYYHDPNWNDYDDEDDE